MNNSKEDFEVLDINELNSYIEALEPEAKEIYENLREERKIKQMKVNKED